MSSRMRVTKGHRNNRRSHHGVANPAVTIDTETGTPHMRHRANPTTGMYRGRKVIETANAVKTNKSEAKVEKQASASTKATKGEEEKAEKAKK